MKSPTMNVNIPAPRHVQNDDFNVLAKMTLSKLCALAEIPKRVSGPDKKTVICIAGDEHFITNKRYYVGVGSRWQETRNAALKVLEILAHGFHDYAARECVCHRGLFAIPKRRGRPTKGRQAMTARERMATMRERQLTRAQA